jgi:hypothetical protein
VKELMWDKWFEVVGYRSSEQFGYKAKFPENNILGRNQFGH